MNLHQRENKVALKEISASKKINPERREGRKQGRKE